VLHVTQGGPLPVIHGVITGTNGLYKGLISLHP